MAEYDRLQGVWMDLEVATNPHKEKPYHRKKLWDKLDKTLKRLRHPRPAGLRMADLAQAFGPQGPEMAQYTQEEWEEKQAKRKAARKRMHDLQQQRLGPSGDSKHAGD